MWEQMSPRVYRNLDEIFAGEYEGKTYEEIKRTHATEASLRAMDKIGQCSGPSPAGGLLLPLVTTAVACASSR